jgi:ubiquinone/menaquinone biosynthesis C-methylase UbiE
MALDKPFLEIGCGTGHWTTFFRQKGLELTAIDISGKMIEKARSKNPKQVRFEVHGCGKPVVAQHDLR